MNGPPEGTRVDTVRLQTLARGFTGSAALFAAIDLGLFTAVAEGAGDVAGLAARLGISELNVERLATLCAAAGLLSPVFAATSMILSSLIVTAVARGAGRPADEPLPVDAGAPAGAAPPAGSIPVEV